MISFKGLRFLVIEDSPSFCHLIKGILRDYSALIVDIAKDGPSAIQYLRKLRYDVILCDYDLGEGQDGHQFFEEAKEQNLIPCTTCFIMVTAETQKHMVFAILENSPDDYITKPVTPDTLTKRIQKIIDYKSIMTDVSDAYQKQDFDTAIQLCDEKIHAYPEHSTFIAKYKGELCLKTGRYFEAQKLYLNALQKQDNPWAKIGLAKTRYLQGYYNKAYSLLMDSLHEAGHNIEAFDILADIMENFGQTKQAQSILMNAVDQSPKIVPRQHNLGRLALRNNDLETAERSFKNAIKFSKHSHHQDINDHFHLAKVLSQKKAHSSAINVLEKAKYQLHRDFKNLLHATALESIELLTHDDQRKAKLLFQRVKEYILDINIDALTEEALFDIAKAHFMFGDEQGGFMLIQKLGIHDMSIIDVDINQFDFDTFQSYKDNHLGSQLYEKKQYQAAIKYFEKAANSMQENISFNLNAAQAILLLMQKEGNDKHQNRKCQVFLERIKTIAPTNKRYQKLQKYFDVKFK